MKIVHWLLTPKNPQPTCNTATPNHLTNHEVVVDEHQPIARCLAEYMINKRLCLHMDNKVYPLWSMDSPDLFIPEAEERLKKLSSYSGGPWVEGRALSRFCQHSDAQLQDHLNRYAKTLATFLENRLKHHPQLQTVSISHTDSDTNNLYDCYWQLDANNPLGGTSTRELTQKTLLATIHLHSLETNIRSKGVALQRSILRTIEKTHQNLLQTTNKNRCCSLHPTVDLQQTQQSTDSLQHKPHG